MEEQTCPNCGKEGFKNLGAHLRYCSPVHIDESGDGVSEVKKAVK